MYKNDLKHSKKHIVTPIRHQQGVALMTVLMIVVLIVVMAAILLSKQNRVLDESNIFLRGQQAYNYALGAETLAAAMLKKDAQINQTDSLLDIWAQPIPTYDVEDGQVSANIVALDGRFNINNLFHDGAVDEVQLQYFKRLLSNLGLDPLLADAVIDWQDEDNEPYSSSGAEVSFYKGIDGAILPTNQPFVSTSELAWVNGFDADALRLLEPHVTALPNYSKININMADEVVLGALSEGLNVTQIKAFIEARPSQPALTDIESFISMPAFSKINSDSNAAKMKSSLAVTSSYFKSYAKVSLDNRVRYLTSSLMRQGADVITYARNDSAFSLQNKSPILVN